MKLKNHKDKFLKEFPEFEEAELEQHLEKNLDDEHLVKEVAKKKGKLLHEFAEEYHKWVNYATGYAATDVQRIIKDADEILVPNHETPSSNTERIIETIDEIDKND